MDPWSDHFSQKGSKWRGPLVGWELPEAELIAIWRRKRFQDAFSSIWSRFGSILKDLGLFSTDF